MKNKLNPILTNKGLHDVKTKKENYMVTPYNYNFPFGGQKRNYFYKIALQFWLTNSVTWSCKFC